MFVQSSLYLAAGDMATMNRVIPFMWLLWLPHMLFTSKVNVCMVDASFASVSRVLAMGF